jgi:hypothetical protein
MMLADDLATWRGPRGYVENVAHAIALAATCNHAAGGIHGRRRTAKAKFEKRTVASSLN